MMSYSAGYAPSIRVSTSPWMPATVPLRRDAWSDVKACALLLAAFMLVIGGMTAAGLR